MFDPPPQLRRTGRTRTTHRHLARPLHHRRATRRTHRRKYKRHRLRRSPCEIHTHECRNDLPGLLHINKIPHAKVPPRDLVAIMQRRPRHFRAREHHRFQLRYRRQHSRASHLNRDPAQPRLRPLRCELVGHRPPRRTFPDTDFALPRHLVQLHHRAVRRKRETRPRRFHRLHRAPQRVRSHRPPDLPHTRQSPRPDFSMQPVLRRR